MPKDYRTIWQQCLTKIQGEIHHQGFQTWFVPIQPVKYLAPTLTIQVPSSFFYEWLEEHYAILLKKVIQNVIGPEGRLAYTIPINEKSSVKTVHKPTPKHAMAAGQNLVPLNKEYTLDNFIEGTTNRLAKSTAEAIASNPGRTSFNPCVFHGPTGTGKTHLAQAIAQDIDPTKYHTLFISAEEFTSHFVDALRKNHVHDFINLYLKMDVLIIDDVQFLAGKAKTQETFFYIFKHNYQHRKQIIMTCDRMPRNIQGLEPRIVSRLKSGMSIGLTVPDFETRLAIIRKQLQETKLTLPVGLQEYIATYVTTNVREIQGVVRSIIGRATLTDEPINLELVKSIISEIATDLQQDILAPDFIIKTVADYYNLAPKVIKGSARHKAPVQARHLAMYMFKQYRPGDSLKAIGNHFNDRDHSSVAYALQSVANMLDTDRAFKTTAEEVSKRIKRANL